MDLNEWIPFYNALEASDREKIRGSIYERSARAGSEVYSDTTSCVGVIVVLDGELRSYFVTDEGKEVTLFRLLSRDMCLFSASCIMHNIDFDVQIQATKDTAFLVIPIPVFEKLMETSLPVVQYMNALMASRFSDVMWLMSAILSKKMDERLAALLFEREDPPESGIVKATHEELAQDLGSAREVVSRMMRYLEKEGLVKKGRGKTEITDREGLMALAKPAMR